MSGPHRLRRQRRLCRLDRLLAGLVQYARCNTCHSYDYELCFSRVCWVYVHQLGVLRGPRATR